MKLAFTTIVLLFSISSFASFNEVECEIALNEKEIDLTVEAPFPRGSAFKQAEMAISENGSTTTHNYTVTSRLSSGGPSIRYTAYGLDLDINLWPDRLPRWGRTYRGELRSLALGNQYIRGLSCRFPNAQW